MNFITALLCVITAVSTPFAAGPLSAQVAGKLVLYTSQPDRDAQQTVDGFRQKNPGVEVEIFRSGTTEVMNKLMAEIAAGQPRADVLLLADALSLERLKAAGIREVVALDLTRREFDVPVVRVVIPGLEGARMHPNYVAGARAGSRHQVAG